MCILNACESIKTHTKSLRIFLSQKGRPEKILKQISQKKVKTSNLAFNPRPTPRPHIARKPDKQFCFQS